MSFTHVVKEDDVAFVWLDHPHDKINKISFDLISEFETLLNTLENDDEVKAIILISKKPDNFIAGADIDAFTAIVDATQAEEASRNGNQLLSRLANFSKPVVAAIHGAALGGGLEIALACHYRIASNDPKTILGLPEVKLGLLPGSGGTQRLPRLVGIQKALNIMLTGKNVYPHQAKRMGLVDELHHPYGLDIAAKTAALSLIGKKPRKANKSTLEKLLEGTSFGRNLILSKARQAVAKSTKGNYPAPLKIIDCVEIGLSKGMQEGLNAESKRFGELMVSPESKQLVNLFFSMNAVKKNPMKEKAKPVEKIGVLGAGLMGSGIAMISANNGMEVVLKDINYDSIGKGTKTIWKELSGKVRKKALTHFERDLIMSRISGSINQDTLKNANLIIEAVFEDLKLKQTILKETEEISDDNAIFASNTSSLPISDIAKNAIKPEQVIGMHYFSPVHKMPLLEIIKTNQTADWVVATAVETGIKQGKTVIVVKDGPGFYTTRILAPMLNEAILLLEEGGNIEQIDDAMKKFGFPVGPFTLMDEIGIDVCAHVTEVLSKLFAKRGVEGSTKMKDLFEAGYMGKKNKIGFYRYKDKSKVDFLTRKKRKSINPTVYAFFGGVNRKTIDDKDIYQRLTWAMVNEAAYCLQENILNSPRDGDLGAILGLGFPPFLGGPFRYLDSLGSKEVLSIMENLESKYGKRFEIAKIIRDYSKKGKLFYNSS
ncbi:fatty acid oxidation complex subunit alpha FadJ [candidate division KSB1 bacterium]|nr:fatty acid oxidation complex subunit alpha FadJ [candidate division KSB1 bacterium]